jgi:Lrp/AsnC family transcriptional regulator, leucine-responsive regulatory protein
MLALDTLDLKILALLQTDGRMSNQLLADKVALSPSACLRRVRMLEESGAISSYRAVLGATALGLDVEALVQVSMRRDTDGWHESFSQAVQHWPQVSAAFIVTGECNYILHVRARNLQEFSEFVIGTLHKAKGVQDIRSNIIMQRIKDGLGLISPELLVQAK